MAEARRKGVEQAAVEMGACCGVGPHELDQAAPVVMVMCAVPPVVGAAPGEWSHRRPRQRNHCEGLPHDVPAVVPLLDEMEPVREYRPGQRTVDCRQFAL